MSSPFTVDSGVGCAVRTPDNVKEDGAPSTPYRGTCGFTLLEAVAALAVAATALLSLLQLQLLALRTADRADVLTQAVLLAQEKMAEVLAGGDPSVGVSSGLLEADKGPFTWRLEVARVPVPVKTHTSPSSPPGPAGRTRLRQLSLEVCGPAGPPIRLTTYLAQSDAHGS